MGDPEPAFGFPRVLQVLLRERLRKPVEVVNVAVTAINSHVIHDIAQDCKRLQGDLWIIYMGNNEAMKWSAHSARARSSESKCPAAHSFV
jgi:hypothetical protein